MKFCEFANLLYDVTSGESKSAFVKTLFESIIIKNNAKAEDIIDSYSEYSYRKYFYGDNNISGIASKLRPYLEPMEFEKYCENFFSDEMASEISDKFRPYIPKIDMFNLGECLADLFMQIIKNAATSKRSSSKKNNNAKKRTKKSVSSTINKTQQVVPTIQDTETSSQNINFSNQNKLLGINAINAEMMKAIQSFSKDYYQLIVTCDEDIFNTNTVFVIPSRALTKNGVPTEIFERCSTLTSEGIEELKHIPAIICTENKDYKGITSPEQFAIFAYIKDIKKCRNNIKISFQSIDVIKQLELCSKENAPHFDINIDCAITDLNISAWTVHKVNLLKALKETNIQMPSRALWEMYCYNG